MRIRLLPPDLPMARWLPYTWLVYLGFLFLVAAFTRHGAGWWELHAGVVAVFLVLYFHSYWASGIRLLLDAGGMMALGAVLVPWNGGASVFFIYAAASVAAIEPPRRAVIWLGVIVLVLGVEALAVPLSIEAWLPGVAFSLLIGGNNIHFAERRRAELRLRLARDEVEHLAKVAERERIARDLHDLLGHTLSVIVLKSELAAKLGERDPGAAVTEIRDVERISREALAEVRHAVQGYRELTLEESLARARQALQAGGVALDASVATGRLDPRLEAVVSAVVREAVTNVIRHARARHCWLGLREDAGWLTLEVRDDGVGGSVVPGTGLTGMRARVESLGGRMDHDGTNGTALRIRLPLAQPRVENA